jgi:hypothetical protein
MPTAVAVRMACSAVGAVTVPPLGGIEGPVRAGSGRLRAGYKKDTNVAASDLGVGEAATFDGIVRTNLLRRPLLGWAIAIAAAVWLLGGTATHAWHAAITVDSAHGWASAASGPLAVNADHTHCGTGLSPWCPESAAVADLSRSASPLLILGVLGAVATSSVSRFGLDRAQQTLRGPPRGPAIPITGHDLLTRLCLARR